MATADGSYEVMATLDEVAFEMIGDDETATRERLDSIRARQPKFVCVNDNMMNPGERLIGTLQNFYLSFFPEAHS